MMNGFYWKGDYNVSIFEVFIAPSFGAGVHCARRLARPRIFIGGYFGPTFYGPAWYGPGWVAPYGYVSGPVTGSVKFETKFKDAAVYVDSAYAGTVGGLKTFHLRPGDHNIELRDHDGHSFYQERVEVIAGKTLKIAAQYHCIDSSPEAGRRLTSGLFVFAGPNFTAMVCLRREARAEGVKNVVVCALTMKRGLRTARLFRFPGRQRRGRELRCRSNDAHFPPK
jgi:hypothetical protein